MSGYIEVMVKGDCRAYLEASSVAGVITASGMSGETPATADAPMSLIMRGGDVLEGVYGVSPNRLLIHLAGVRLLMKERNRLCVVAYLDTIPEFEAQIDSILAARESTFA